VESGVLVKTPEDGWYQAKRSFDVRMEKKSVSRRRGLKIGIQETSRGFEAIL
jgi:hypothetical protein